VLQNASCSRRISSLRVLTPPIGMTKLRIKDVLQFPTVKNERIGRVMEKICRFEHSQSKRMERADSYVSTVVLVVSGAVRMNSVA